MLESFERSVVVYTAMEDSKFAEDLATIVKQLERVDLMIQKTGLTNMAGSDYIRI